MNIKSNDIEYLGVNKEKILKAYPVFDEEKLKEYLHYIVERQEVLKKRQQGKNYPWTDDEIIKNNSFTNNHRFNDRYSRYVLNNIINDNKTSLSDRIYKSLLSRIYNCEGFCELVNISNPNFWNEEVVKDNIKKLENAEVKDGQIYTKAYRIIQPKVCYKEIYPNNHYKAHPLLYINDLRKKYGETIADLFKSFNARRCYEWIHTNVRGAGPFIAYQMFCDISYFKEIPFSDRLFVVSGPGCTRGFSYLYKDWDGLSAEELLWWHRNHLEEELRKAYGFGYDKLFDNEPISNRYFDLQECENSGCEFSKYIQLLEGRQKKIRRYREENIKPIILTTAEIEQNMFMESEYLLRNSQYKNLKVEQVKSEDKWQITDTKNRVRFKDIPTKVYETIKEITQINNESEEI